MLLTWVLVGGAVAMLVAGIVWAWRSRPLGSPEHWDDGETKYLQAQNIAKAQDFGLSQKYRDHRD